VERGFPALPAGCHIELDRVAQEIVLGNGMAALHIDWHGLVAELRRLGDVSLGAFIEGSAIELEEIYRRRRGGWAGLRRLAGFDDRPPGTDDQRLSGAIGRMLHVDDQGRLSFLDELISRTAPPAAPSLEERTGRLTAMLHFALWGPGEALEGAADGFRRLWANAARREELAQLVAVLRGRMRRVTRPADPAGRIPLHIHARYSRDEALAAFGVDKPAVVRQGVKWVEAERADVFFVTLRKTERHYSPSTMYNDRAVTPSIFQWESQSTTSEAVHQGEQGAGRGSRRSSVHVRGVCHLHEPLR
jgi:hypothetical protein